VRKWESEKVGKSARRVRPTFPLSHLPTFDPKGTGSDGCNMKRAYSFSSKFLRERLCERRRGWRGFRSFSWFSRLQMGQQINSSGRRRDEEPFLFITDDVKRMTSAQRTRFDHVELRRTSAMDRQPLPIAEQPHAAEENAEHQRQREHDTSERRTDVSQGSVQRDSVGGLSSGGVKAEKKSRLKQKDANGDCGDR
jgi:hypothetical protein